MAARRQRRPEERGTASLGIQCIFCHLEPGGVYTKRMSAHKIGNPVPTPEQMGQILGLSSERVAAVRRIMSTPAKEKTTDRSDRVVRSKTRKKSTRVQISSRATGKR